MTRIREGFLSDENMKKMCAEHRPIPMNRLDLLPRPMENRSGLYSRPLKQPQILSRPASAKTMLDATRKLTGKDLSEDYKLAVKKEMKLPVYPKTLSPLSSSVQSVYGTLSSSGIPLADLSYAQLISRYALPSLIDTESEASGFVFEGSVDTPSISETESRMAELEELRSEYQIRDEDEEPYTPYVPPSPISEPGLGLVSEPVSEPEVSSFPRTPSILGPELQQAGGRGRPPTVTVPKEVVRQIREFEEREARKKISEFEERLRKEGTLPESSKAVM